MLLRSALFRPSAVSTTARLLASRQFITSSESRLGEAASDQAQSGDDGIWGQTKIGEVLKGKKDDSSWLYCSKDDKVIQAVRKMTQANVGSLLVVDPALVPAGTPASPGAISFAVCGIVTERDYLTKVAVDGKSSENIVVSDIMTPKHKLKVVGPETTVIQAMQTMVDSNVRHLPVVTDGSMVGMVSIRDAVKSIVDEFQQDVAHMKDYISGTY